MSFVFPSRSAICPLKKYIHARSPSPRQSCPMSPLPKNNTTVLEAQLAASYFPTLARPLRGSSSLPSGRFKSGSNLPTISTAWTTASVSSSNLSRHLFTATIVNLKGYRSFSVRLNRDGFSSCHSWVTKRTTSRKSLSGSVHPSGSDLGLFSPCKLEPLIVLS